MSIVLGPNQYGKAENRVVRIIRDTARHEIRDLNVSTSLRGEFHDAHITGDQANVLPTDTQKNTAFVFAKKHGITSPEDYAIALGNRLLDVATPASAARIEVEEFAWDRIPVGGSDTGHDHAFVRRGGDTRTVVATIERGADSGDERSTHVIAGITDLVVLKSTGSEFKGYLRDEYTTLQETSDRILATSLVARWRYSSTDVDWNKSFDSIRSILLETFATTHSLALQQSLYAMGQAVLESHTEVAEIRFSAPNKHHFLVDFSAFDDVDNNGEVFIAADRPYGLIEASVLRDDAPDAGDAWLTTPGFC